MNVNSCLLTASVSWIDINMDRKVCLLPSLWRKFGQCSFLPDEKRIHSLCMCGFLCFHRFVYENIKFFHHLQSCQAAQNRLRHCFPTGYTCTLWCSVFHTSVCIYCMFFECLCICLVCRACYAGAPIGKSLYYWEKWERCNMKNMTGHSGIGRILKMHEHKLCSVHFWRITN